jgi:hypothetical protein
LISGIEKGSDVVTSQAPLIADEILAFDFMSCLAGMFLCIVIAAFLFYLGTRCRSAHNLAKAKEHYYYNDWTIGICICWGATLIPIICFFTLGLAAVQIKTAPKYYLIDKITHIRR